MGNPDITKFYQPCSINKRVYSFTTNMHTETYIYTYPHRLTYQPSLRLRVLVHTNRVYVHTQLSDVLVVVSGI